MVDEPCRLSAPVPEDVVMNGNRFGRLFQVTTFGESHGEAMGCTVSGCPAGLELSEEDIQADLDRRKPGQSMITTSRGEPDDVSIKSGIQDGYTTGTPIGLVIQNKDARSGKYEPSSPRPGPPTATSPTRPSSGRETGAAAVARRPAKRSTGSRRVPSRRNCSHGRGSNSRPTSIRSAKSKRPT